MMQILSFLLLLINQEHMQLFHQCSQLLYMSMLAMHNSNFMCRKTEQISMNEQPFDKTSKVYVLPSIDSDSSEHALSLEHTSLFCSALTNFAFRFRDMSLSQTYKLQTFGGVSCQSYVTKSASLQTIYYTLHFCKCFNLKLLPTVTV